MNDKVTLDGILAWFRQAVEDKQPISPEVWLDGAQKLNILQEDLDDAIVVAEMFIAQKKSESIAEGASVSVADRMADASPESAHLRLLLAKKKRVEEHIRIAKKRAEIRTFGSI